MNRILTLLFAIASLGLLSSCGGKKDEPKHANAQRTVLVYALGSNNLSSDLAADKNEMVQAAPDIKGLGRDVRVLLYSISSKTATEATLSELTKDATGQWDFVPLKSYDRNTFSTDPKRISLVFSDLRQEAPADAYGLIFWAHGTSWLPNFSDHEVPTTKGLQKSYGWDTYQDVRDYCDIDELAGAIPDRMFDYIWFDNCYMMGVEVVYQLRNKCNYIAGYPTEDWQYGMNYETTLPMLAAKTPDLAGAGKAFFDYYFKQYMAVTVTVMRTDGLESLADTAAEIYAKGKRPVSTNGLMIYSRNLPVSLYDFGQFTKKYLDSSDPETKSLTETFDNILKDMTIYARCTTKDFNYTEGAFDPEQYSGLSCYFPGSASYSIDSYYRTLDWAKRVNP